MKMMGEKTIVKYTCLEKASYTVQLCIGACVNKAGNAHKLLRQHIFVAITVCFMLQVSR